MHEVLVNRLGGLSLPRKSVVRLTDRPDMSLDVYRGRKTTMQQQQQQSFVIDTVLAQSRPTVQQANCRNLDASYLTDWEKYSVKDGVLYKT